MTISYKALPSESLQVTGSKLTIDLNNLKSYNKLYLFNPCFEELDNFKLYKYFSIENLGYLLKNRKLFMDRIQSWEDSFENFFLKCNIEDNGKIFNAESQTQCLFGQSWTLKEETDALWRIYSPDKFGIRIKSNFNNLHKAIFVDDECIANVWMGKVVYYPMQKISSIIEGRIKGVPLFDVYQKIFPSTIFMKRIEFSHEEEFRVSFMVDSRFSITQCKRLAFNIDPDTFIEEYCLDPRLNESEFDTQKKRLLQMGANEDKIVQSQLYAFRPITFRI